MKRFIFFLFLASLVFSKSYYLPSAEVTFDIRSNGSVFVTEKINYQLIGCFKELYLEKPNDLPIINPSGQCIGAACNFRVDEPSVSVSQHRELILALQSNECNSKVTAVFNYEIHVVKKLKDGAQFFQKLWGDWWEKGTSLTAIVKMPGNNGYEYYIHPWGAEYETQKIGNTLTFITKQPAETFFEINLLMPKEWFGEGNFIQESYGVNDVRRTESEDKTKWEIAQFVKTIFYLISTILFLMPLFLFVYLYLKYGREEKLNYFAEYERDLPSNDTPAQVNALVNNFKVNTDAFIATILNLVDEKKLKMRTEKVKNKILFIENEFEDIIFTIVENNKEIPKEDASVYALLKKYAKGNEISFSELKKQISKDFSFSNWFERWKDYLENAIGKYITFEGPNQYFKYSFICLGLIFAMAILSLLFDFTDDLLILIWFGTFFGFIIGNIIAFSAKNILGKWRNDGHLMQKKWINFRKYISDFSLLKEHPPQSIALWDKYLVYAVALGVGEKTIKAMKMIVPKYNGEFAVFYYSPKMYMGLNSGINNSFAASSRGSGKGGFGGGMGGGGFGGGGGGGGAR